MNRELNSAGKELMYGCQVEYDPSRVSAMMNAVRISSIENVFGRFGIDARTCIMGTTKFSIVY